MAKIDLSTVGERDRLRPKPNRAPYWQRLRPGCFLGYRPSSDGSAGTWAARAYIDGDFRVIPLGSFGEFVAKERFAKAKAAAEAFMAREETGGDTRALLVTVADACREYAKTHSYAEFFFKHSVYDDPIAGIRLEKLRRSHLVAWRERVAMRPVAIGRNGTAAGGRRAPSSINREMTPLRAALNQVLPYGMPKTEAAWQEALKNEAFATRRRTLTLDRDQRQALLAHVDAEIEPLVRALCLMPVRPGALSQLLVSDFDKKTGVLTIRDGIDKKHPERHIHLSAAAAALLAAQAKDKTPATLLFMRANRKAWHKQAWFNALRPAVVAAKLPPETTAYTLRHSVITDLVNAGIPTLTIAQLAGTSVQMIQSYYGHLLEEAARRALDALAL